MTPVARLESLHPRADALAKLLAVLEDGLVADSRDTPCERVTWKAAAA